MNRKLAGCLLALAAPIATAQLDHTSPQQVSVYEVPDGSVVAADVTGTFVFDTWTDYFQSAFFSDNGMHCGVRTPEGGSSYDSTSDCNSSNTNPSSLYAPSGDTFVIPVVFHIFMHSNGNGAVSDQQVGDQIQILNNDYASLTNSNIQFVLAPGGIERYTNSTWYNDSGNYTSTAWDTNLYLNIYTNTAGGNLGYAYVPSGGGVVGTSFDGVRLYWQAVGYTNFTPYHLGRSATHEVGHYLGLYHTFDGGCGGSNCYQSGDLICDTNAESSANFSACQPSQSVTCGSQDPVRNYMDYSDDICMDNFTSEQARRMRCTLMNFRVDLAGTGGGTPPGAAGSPSPANGAASVATTSGLSWSAGSGATSYDVYFGTDSTPDAGELQGNQGGTSYAPGTLAFSTTYYWRIDSVNAAGTTTGSVWSFTTAADGGSGGNIFSEGFESGGYSAGGWTTTNSNARITTASHSGAYASWLRRSTTITTTIDTSGTGGATLSFYASTSGYESSERMLAQYSTNGSTWTTVATVSNSTTSYTLFSASVPASASLRIRFTTNANRNNERTYLDDILVN